MNPAFFKALDLIVKVQGRPELVQFAAGFSKPVDPLSGMTVNLREINQWMDSWKIAIESQNFQSWPEFLMAAQIYFSKCLDGVTGLDPSEGQDSSAGAVGTLSQNAKVAALQVKFFDSSILRVEAGQMFYELSGVCVDSFRNLHLLRLKLAIETESEFERLRNSKIPSDFPSTFTETGLLRNYFESKLGLPVLRLEIENPISKVAAVI